MLEYSFLPSRFGNDHLGAVVVEPLPEVLSDQLHRDPVLFQVARRAGNIAAAAA